MATRRMFRPSPPAGADVAMAAGGGGAGETGSPGTNATPMPGDTVGLMVELVGELAPSPSALAGAKAFLRGAGKTKGHCAVALATSCMAASHRWLEGLRAPRAWPWPGGLADEGSQGIAFPLEQCQGKGRALEPLDPQEPWTQGWDLSQQAASSWLLGTQAPRCPAGPSTSGWDRPLLLCTGPESSYRHWAPLTHPMATAEHTPQAAPHGLHLGSPPWCGGQAVSLAPPWHSTNSRVWTQTGEGLWVSPLLVLPLATVVSTAPEHRQLHVRKMGAV